MELNRRTFLGLTALAAAGASRAAATPSRTVGLLFDTLISPFWVASLQALRAEARRRGWSVLEAVSNADPERQYTQVQSMIELGVDGIVIIPTDAKAVIPALRAADAARVPIVNFNRPPAASDVYSVAVAADNRGLMRRTVSALIEIARHQGDHCRAAILVGDLGDANAVSRLDGFDDAVAPHRGFIEIVARVATEWNADKAFAGLSDALQAHRDINFIVTSSDFLAPQIEQALRAAGKWAKAGEPGHVLIAGFDGDENGYEQLEAGYFDVDGVQNLYYEVRLAFDALQTMWAGGNPPKVLLDPGFVISRENLFTAREDMWGYVIAKRGLVSARGTAVPASRQTVASRALTAEPIRAVAVKAGRWTAASALVSALAFARTFFSLAALRDTFLAMLPLAILVTGQTLVLLIGEIDLSMTSVMALSSVLSTSLMTEWAAPFGDLGSTGFGVSLSLLTGVLIGLFNGVCAARLRIPSFIVTLAVMLAGSGAAVWYVSAVSGSVSIGGLPHAFRALGYGTAAGVPIALLLCAAVVIGGWYGLTRTLLGRWVYAVGRNASAARISGVPVPAVTIAVFAASGFCAALASVIYTGRIETGLPTLGQNMLLDIVGAAVIGGVSLFGGRGSILTALLGVAFLSLLDKSVQLLGLSLFAVLGIKGIAILIAASADAVRGRRSMRS